jgi:2-polyprenyl-3-methyl-5-hydroxy-6-metoxy-1,4-benzoquinol methylase
MNPVNPPSSNADLSNGWELIAGSFIEKRNPGIGLAIVKAWAESLKPGATILDIGCGFGVAYSQFLINAGFKVCGIDASPTLIKEFQRRFPQTEAACEAAETSSYFGRRFDGVIAIGLMFLLPEEAQLQVLQKVARALNPHGKFLFTSPLQVCIWKDILTGRESKSLGKAVYVRAMLKEKLSLVGDYCDEGGNQYFYFVHSAS